MKKLFVVFCLLGILLVNCASTGNVENNNRGFNSEIHGELYIEKNAGFSMHIPKGWEIRDMNQKYLMIIGPVEDNFSPNINFVDEQYSGQIPEYIDAAIALISQFYADLEVIENENFMTNTGLEGSFITLHGRINEIEVRQKIYVIPNKIKSMVMVITGSASSASGTKFDMLFDECIKTFNWTK
ncbi:MAG: hypothetical protein LBH43_04795 [Treponema sp.]|jgi:hypothetical protein|nr:hypothetical protein [Treponema sp.]